MKSPPSFKTSLLTIVDEIIEPWLTDIRHEAQVLIGEHKAKIRAENARRNDFDDHAKLTPYITKNANGYVYMYWGRYSGWRTVSGRRLRNTKHIKTAPSGNYPESVLIKYSQPWEIAFVKDTELRLRAVRKKQTHLGQARLAIANLTSVNE